VRTTVILTRSSRGQRFGVGRRAPLGLVSTARRGVSGRGVTERRSATRPAFRLGGRRCLVSSGTVGESESNSEVTCTRADAR